MVITPEMRAAINATPGPCKPPTLVKGFKERLLAWLDTRPIPLPNYPVLPGMQGMTRSVFVTMEGSKSVRGGIPVFWDTDGPPALHEPDAYYAVRPAGYTGGKDGGGGTMRAVVRPLPMKAKPDPDRSPDDFLRVKNYNAIVGELYWDGFGRSEVSVRAGIFKHRPETVEGKIIHDGTVKGKFRAAPIEELIGIFYDNCGLCFRGAWVCQPMPRNRSRVEV